eukprot:89151_1
MAQNIVETSSDNYAQKALESIAKCFPVKCSCGAEMTIKHTMTAYHSSVAWCDGCKKSMQKSEYSFHCPRRGTVSSHSSGFDYCFDCGVKQYHTQRDDLMNNELDVIYHAKYTDIDKDNVNRIMNELCDLQSKQLRIIESIHSRMSNESDEKQNVKQDKIELNQTQVHYNINALQQMFEHQQKALPITVRLLKIHSQLISNWKEWGVADVIYWMTGVNNGAFKQYTKEVTQGCTKENVKGTSLKYVDDNCLLRWGVYDIGMRNQLVMAIQTLIQTQQDETGMVCATDYGQQEGK